MEIFRPASPIVPGTEFGRYRVLTPLGEGGMAMVYLAEMLGTGGFSKLVALKIVRPVVASNPLFSESFVSEARLGGLLSHPNIVEIFDFGEHEGRPYLGMEYVAGMSLQGLIARHRNLGSLIAPEVCLQLLIKVCHGLAYAHEASDRRGRPLKMVHRDIKPANVLVSAVGKVKIADFGVARAESNVAETRVDGLMKGSVRYMSPEQAYGDGDLDRRSDLFSVGVVLFELLTLTPLYVDNSFPKLLRTAQNADVGEQLTRVPACPLHDPLVQLLEKALARERNERFQDASELCAAMQMVLELCEGGASLDKWLARVVPRSLPRVQEHPGPAVAAPPGSAQTKVLSAASPAPSPLRQRSDRITSEEGASDPVGGRSEAGTGGPPGDVPRGNSVLDAGLPVLDVSDELTVRAPPHVGSNRIAPVPATVANITPAPEPGSTSPPPTLVSLGEPRGSSAFDASRRGRQYAEWQASGGVPEALEPSFDQSRAGPDRSPGQERTRGPVPEDTMESSRLSPSATPSPLQNRTMVLDHGSGDRSQTLDCPHAPAVPQGRWQTFDAGLIGRVRDRLKHPRSKRLAFVGLGVLLVAASWVLWPGSAVNSDPIDVSARAGNGDRPNRRDPEPSSMNEQPAGTGGRRHETNTSTGQARDPSAPAGSELPHGGLRQPGSNPASGRPSEPDAGASGSTHEHESIGSEVDSRAGHPRQESRDTAVLLPGSATGKRPPNAPVIAERDRSVIRRGVDRDPCLNPSTTSGIESAAGVLALNSRPCRRIYLDGKRLEDCPLETCWVPSGEHSIRFLDPGTGRELSKRVKVPTGRRVTCAGVFEERRIVCEEDTIARDR